MQGYNPRVTRIIKFLWAKFGNMGVVVLYLYQNPKLNIMSQKQSNQSRETRQNPANRELNEVEEHQGWANKPTWELVSIIQNDSALSKRLMEVASDIYNDAEAEYGLTAYENAIGTMAEVVMNEVEEELSYFDECVGLSPTQPNRSWEGFQNNMREWALCFIDYRAIATMLLDRAADAEDLSHNQQDADQNQNQIQQNQNAMNYIQIRQEEELLKIRTFCQSYSTHHEYDYYLMIPYTWIMPISPQNSDRGNGSWIINQRGRHYLIVADHYDGDPERDSFYREEYQVVRVHDLEELPERPLSEIAKMSNQT